MTSAAPADRTTVDRETEPSPLARPLGHLPARPARDFFSRTVAAGLVLNLPVAGAGLVVDLTTYTVQLDGQELDVSPRQAELLAIFLAAPHRVWSREQLNWVCWGDTAPSRRVDVQLCRLRAKTGRDLFRNVRDRGWALRPLA